MNKKKLIKVIKKPIKRKIKKLIGMCLNCRKNVEYPISLELERFCSLKCKKAFPNNRCVGCLINIKLIAYYRLEKWKIKEIDDDKEKLLLNYLCKNCINEATSEYSINFWMCRVSTSFLKKVTLFFDNINKIASENRAKKESQEKIEQEANDKQKLENAPRIKAQKEQDNQDDALTTINNSLLFNQVCAGANCKLTLNKGETQFIIAFGYNVSNYNNDDTPVSSHEYFCSEECFIKYYREY